MAMTYRARVWLHGALAALIAGFANAFIVTAADPEKFNLFDGGFTRLLIVSFLSGAIGLMTYLKDHPLPDPDKDTDAQSAATSKISDIKVSLMGTGDGGPSTGPGKMLGVLVALGVGALTLSGCAGGRALVATNPTAPAVQDVRHASDAAAVMFETGFKQFTELGVQIDTMPGLSTGQKDAYDCSILHLTGTASTPSPATATACGDLPLRDASPLKRLTASVKTATSCVGLRSTLNAFRPELLKGLTALESSTNTGVRMAVVLLRIQFALVLNGDVACQ
jgi:hypothetical protein